MLNPKLAFSHFSVNQSFSATLKCAETLILYLFCLMKTQKNTLKTQTETARSAQTDENLHRYFKCFLYILDTNL